MALRQRTRLCSQDFKTVTWSNREDGAAAGEERHATAFPVPLPPSSLTRTTLRKGVGEGAALVHWLVAIALPGGSVDYIKLTIKTITYRVIIICKLWATRPLCEHV